MRKIWFGLTGLVSLLGVSFGAVSAAPPLFTDPRALLQISKDDRILGKPDAPITIVEYASLSCHHCAHFANDVLPEIRKEWIDTGKAKLVLRDFPTDQAALPAAMVARCAPPERYYAFVDTFSRLKRNGRAHAIIARPLRGWPSSAAWARASSMPASRIPSSRTKSSNNG